MILERLKNLEILSGVKLEDPEARRAYRDHDLQLRLRRLRIGSLMIVVLEPLGFNLDRAVYPDHFDSFLQLRLVCALLAGLVFAASYLPKIGSFHRPLGVLLPLLPNFFTAWMIYATQGSLSPYYAGINQVLMAVALVMPWTAWETGLVCAFSTAFYLGACHLNGPLDRSGVFNNNLAFLLYTELIILIGSHLTHQWRKRQFALSHELDRNKRGLEVANRKLVELDQAKTRFFANISHELRTPLTLLISPLEALLTRKTPALDPEIRGTLGLMQGNALRLLKLINDLLDLVKLESGAMGSRKEPVELGTFVKGLALSVEGVARDKGVRIRAETEPSLGRGLLDRDKMEKILLNLLFNAVKFTPAGGKIGLTAVREQGDLVLRVEDTGMGIEVQDLPFIFDRFWQADPSDQRKYQGTGIGLSLVKELTLAMGGTVEAQSQVGRGTSMTVKVPCEGTTRTPEPRGEEGPSSGSEEWLTRLYRRAELFPGIAPLSGPLGSEVLPSGKKPKLLVADDEPDMLRFLKSQLEGDYEVLEAQDGDQAVEMARQYLPEIVLLDMMMPGKDGISACREIKNSTTTRTLPVLLLTARADDATKLEALKAGASDFLAKPFSVTELHVRVGNLVGSHRFQKELTRQKSALESTLEQLKDTETQLVQTEKMASLGRLSAGIIHEINNPLNYSVAALRLLRAKGDLVPPPERSKYLEILGDAEEGVTRVARIVSDLRNFTRTGAGVPGRVDLKEALDTTLRFLGAELKDRVNVAMEDVEGLSVWMDGNDLIHVLVNLVQNALDALRERGPGGEEPRILIRGREEGGKVLLIVRDNGIGIAADHLDKIFDPFFTTKEVGRGMGLGLSICYKLVQRQGGSISAKSEPGKYAEFVLELPVERPTEAPGVGPH